MHWTVFYDFITNLSSALAYLRGFGVLFLVPSLPPENFLFIFLVKWLLLIDVLSLNLEHFSPDFWTWLSLSNLLTWLWFPCAWKVVLCLSQTLLLVSVSNSSVVICLVWVCRGVCRPWVLSTVFLVFGTSQWLSTCFAALFFLLTFSYQIESTAEPLCDLFNVGFHTFYIQRHFWFF